EARPATVLDDDAAAGAVGLHGVQVGAAGPAAAGGDGDQPAGGRPGRGVVGRPGRRGAAYPGAVGVHDVDGVPGLARLAARRAGAGKGDRVGVGGGGGVVVEGELVGRAAGPAAVEADRVQLQVAVALGDERDAPAVGGEGGVVVEGGVVGEPARAARLHVED